MSSVEDLIEETGSKSAEDMADMARVGHAVMEEIGRHGWTYSDCPSEILVDLANKLDDAATTAHDLTALQHALSKVETTWPGSFWHLAKGRTRADEPMFGFQVLFGTDEVLSEGEGDTAEQAINAALAKAVQS